MQRVGLQHFEQQLLALRCAKLRMLWEGAMYVPGDDIIHFLLANADLEQGVVPTLF